MKDVKKYSVQWTDCDSNRECPKFNKVGKPLSSTITVVLIIIHRIRKVHCQQFTLNTSQFVSNPLGETSFITGRGKFRCIIPSVLVTNTQRCFNRSV